MLMVLFSWLVASAASLLFGKAIIDRLYHNDLSVLGKLDVYFVAGITFLNVYAQFFSIFYKVSKAACMILTVLEIILAVGYAVSGRQKKEQLLYTGFLKEHPYRSAVLFGEIFVTIVWTVQAAGHPDTALYHAQAIRWIEEYGLVLGLGNLHTRLAYNSAFMSLQALFSLKWLFGQSLHSLNGLFSAFFLGYAVMTVRTRKIQKWETSDYLKCAMAAYIILTRRWISSSGTDLWAMLLVMYVCIKWCEFAETREKSLDLWCFVCLVGIYAVTVKLSTAMVVLLTIYPVYMLLQKKDWRRILGNAVTALLIVLPFFIRNILISGYLLYPYGGIDLFSVDWKMDKQELLSDSRYIKLFARGYTNMSDYDRPPSQWIPYWFRTQRTGTKLLIVTGVICAILLLLQLFNELRRKQIREVIFKTMIIASLIFWFVSAPLDRFGAVYLLIVIAATIGGIKWNANIYKLMDIGAVLVMIPLIMIYASKLGMLVNMEREYWVKQVDYETMPSKQYQVDHIMIWVPVKGDCAGYDAFPAATNANNLEGLHCRGEGLQDGFYKE